MRVRLPERLLRGVVAPAVVGDEPKPLAPQRASGESETVGDASAQQATRAGRIEDASGGVGRRRVRQPHDEAGNDRRGVGERIVRVVDFGELLWPERPRGQE